MSAWSAVWVEGWQARSKIRKYSVLALASWPANMKMKMLPRTAGGGRRAAV